MRLRAFAAFAISAAVFELGCSERSKPRGTESRPPGSGKTAEAESERPRLASSTAKAVEPAAAATEGARATAVGSAPRAGGAPDEADPTSLAALFRGDVPAGGTPRPIFRSGVGSGAIVLVAKPFGDGSGVYGEGYKTGTSIHQGATSSLGFGAGPDDGKDLDHDSEASLKTACYSEMVKDVKWEPPAHVKLGRDEVPAIVRRGDGTYVGGKGAWRVYRVTTVIGKTRVGGCGAWSAEHPELETSVISVLKSIRLGVGAPTDRGFE